MPLFSLLDLGALAFFLFAWGAYTAMLAWTERRKRGLNSEMDRYRELWMTELLGREMRMVDAQTPRRSHDKRQHAAAHCAMQQDQPGPGSNSDIRPASQ